MLQEIDGKLRENVAFVDVIEIVLINMNSKIITFGVITVISIV